MFATNNWISLLKCLSENNSNTNSPHALYRTWPCIHFSYKAPQFVILSIKTWWSICAPRNFLSVQVAIILAAIDKIDHSTVFVTLGARDDALVKEHTTCHEIRGFQTELHLGNIKTLQSANRKSTSLKLKFNPELRNLKEIPELKGKWFNGG